MFSSTFSIDYLTNKETGGGLRNNSTGSDECMLHSPVSSIGNYLSGSESEIPETTEKVLLSMGKSSKASKSDTSDMKPGQSYIAMISMAILSRSEQKMVLCDIYQYIMDHFSSYNNSNKAWRNSIRHNLSLNECFVKRGRSENGKGNYWSIHPACIEDFSRGDFRRRQARRRARKSMKEVDPTMYSIKGRSDDMLYIPMTSSAVGYSSQTSYPYAQAGWGGCGSGMVSPPMYTSPFIQHTPLAPPVPPRPHNMASW